MLTSIQSAGVAPEVNLRNSWHAGDKACKRGNHPGFETQGRRHQKSKTGVLVASKKDSCPPKILKKKCILFMSDLTDVSDLHIVKNPNVQWNYTLSEL